MLPLAALIPQPSTLYFDSCERLTTATVAQGQWPQDQCLHPLDHPSETTAAYLLHTNKAIQLPSPLEVPVPGTPEQVAEELRLWGHFVTVLDCDPHPV